MFCYAIEERFNMDEKEFSQKALEVLKDFREVLGKMVFGLQRAIISQIRQTFEVSESGVGLLRTVELAKRNYLQCSL